MRISAAELGYYHDAMDAIGKSASDYLNQALESIAEGAGVTEARETAISALVESVSIHGEMAQALAGQLFDEVCTAEGIGALSFKMQDGIIDRGMLEEKVRYYARALVDGDTAKFTSNCASLADMYAWKCNRTSMVNNCKSYGVRYARVPTSVNPCDWCVMLASRGFVYHSEDDAEAGGHEHCHCIVCPGTSDTTIEGYDPDELYAQWKESGFMTSSSVRRSRAVSADDDPSIMADDEALKLASKLLRGTSKMSRDEVMEAIVRADTEWKSGMRHSVDMDNNFANRIARLMREYNISTSELSHIRQYLFK